MVERVAADELGPAGLRADRAQARGPAWQAGAHADGLLLADVDVTLVDAHSDKQGATGTYKGGFWIYPLVCFLDRGDGTGEALAGILRPGNACSNTAADHVEVIDLALAQLPSTTARPASRGPRRGAGRRRGCLAARGRPRRPATRRCRGRRAARLDLTGWPPDTRVICRRERPHPGAQLSFSTDPTSAS